MTPPPSPIQPFSDGVLRIATRSSNQARTQAGIVADQLRRRWPTLKVDLVFVETLGDRTQQHEVPLHRIGGQGVFVKEVQRAVLDGRADLAVHSAKDLTSTPTDGLEMAAVTARRDPRDALIGRSLATLDLGATVATGSVRRRAQLAELRPDLRFVELRGNINRRLEKIPADGAILMAVAALEVLDLTDLVAEAFEPEVMVPQVGQGAVVVECRVDVPGILEACRAIEDPVSRQAIEIERAFLAEIGSGCSLPVGAYATPPDADGRRRLLTYLQSAPKSGVNARTGVTSGARRTVELDGLCHGDDLDLARRLAHELAVSAGQ